MCKRYYVEVMGLGEDGETQLIEAGIAEKAILVVDEEERSNLVARIIKEVTGIPFDEIKSTASTRYVVLARMLYVHYSIEFGKSIGKISEETGRCSREIYRYMSDYGNKVAGDIEFAKTSDDVMKVLEESAEWKEARKMRKDILSRMKKRKRKRRKVKSRMPQNTKLTTQNKQLYINF